MSETGNGLGLTCTLAGLRAMLRIRLNDAAIGSYSVDDMDYFINLAYRETVVKARCHKALESVNLVQNQTDYVLSTIFEPVEVNLSGVQLNRKELGDLSISLSAWASAAAGTPTDWVHMSGATVRLHPKPSTAGTLAVYGYGFPAALTGETDAPSAIPPAFAVSAILDRAEAEARKARLSYSNNASVAEALMRQWNGWVEQIQRAVGGR